MGRMDREFYIEVVVLAQSVLDMWNQLFTDEGW
jgi:hypothetical protein